jgi:hypothetical protein
MQKPEAAHVFGHARSLEFDPWSRARSLAPVARRPNEFAVGMRKLRNRKFLLTPCPHGPYWFVHRLWMRLWTTETFCTNHARIVKLANLRSHCTNEFAVTMRKLVMTSFCMARAESFQAREALFFPTTRKNASWSRGPLRKNEKRAALSFPSSGIPSRTLYYRRCTVEESWARRKWTRNSVSNIPNCVKRLRGQDRRQPFRIRW